MNRQRQAVTVDLIIGAMQKLDPRAGERQNVTAFVQSCYGGRVRTYDFDAARQSLDKLTPEEHQALVEYLLQTC